MDAQVRYTGAKVIDRSEFCRRVTAGIEKRAKSGQNISFALVSCFRQLDKTKLCTFQMSKSQLSTEALQSSNIAYSDMSLSILVRSKKLYFSDSCTWHILLNCCSSHFLWNPHYCRRPYNWLENPVNYLGCDNYGWLSKKEMSIKQNMESGEGEA